MATICWFALLPSLSRSTRSTAGPMLCMLHQRQWTSPVGRACYSTSKSVIAGTQRRESTELEKMDSTSDKSSSEGSKKNPTKKVSGEFSPLKFLAGRSSVTTEVLQKWACSRALLNGALPERGLHLEKWSALEGSSEVNWWNVQQQTARDVESLRQHKEKLEHRLFEVGFSKKELELLLQVLPDWLEVDLTCVHSVYRVLQNNGMSEEWIHDLLKNSFSIFLQCSSEVEKRFSMFKSVDLRNDELNVLLRHFPSLLSCPLTRLGLAKVKAARDLGFGAHWHREKSSSVGHELTPDAKGVVDILKAYDLDPAFVLIRDPQFFNQSSKYLMSIVKVLSWKPLYMDARDIQHLLFRVPRQLRGIANEQVLSDHLHALCRLFLSYDVHYSLRHCPSIISPSCDVEKKANVLEEVGFSAEERASIAYTLPVVLLQDTSREFEPRIRALTTDAGISPSAVVNSPVVGRLTENISECRLVNHTQVFTIRVLTIPLDVVEARCSFAKQYNPSLLDGSNLEDLICSTDKRFAKLCNQTVNHFYRTGGQQRMILSVSTAVWRPNRWLASRQATTERSQMSVELESKPVWEKDKDEEVEGVELEPERAFNIVEEKDKDKIQESAVLESEQIHRLTEEKEQAILALESEPVCRVKEEKERDKKWSINIEELITEFSDQDGIRDGTAASEVVEEVATTLVAASKKMRRTKSKGRMGKSVSKQVTKGITQQLSTGSTVTLSIDGNVSTKARVPELNKGDTAEKRNVSFGLSKESTKTGAKLVELGSDTLEDSAEFEGESHLLGPLPA